MATEIGSYRSTVARTRVRPVTAVNQAYQILHVAFVVAPTVAGIDKFFHALTNWDGYLAPSIARLLPWSGHNFMLIVGVVEIATGLLVAVSPRIGAYVVAAWLGGIIVNLLLAGGFYDVALRDFGLMLGALALGRLAKVEDVIEHSEVVRRTT